MARQRTQIRLAASRPRNPVVRALARAGQVLATRRHKTAALRRSEQLDRLELDARVREVGEW
jgi:hypothetical protein